MKKTVLVLMAGLLLIGANLYAADGDLFVNGNLGVGTDTPDQKLVVNGGIIKSTGGYASHGFVSDFDSAGDPTTVAFISGLERGAFLFSKCVPSLGNCPHAFSIQARDKADVLNATPAGKDSIFEITEYGMASIGRKEPRAGLDVVNRANAAYALKLSSASGNGDLITVKRGGYVGIGTTNPLSKLAVSGLSTTKPDASATKGVLCITENGNIWIETDNDCFN